MSSISYMPKETPPRVWRKLTKNETLPYIMRNTSTCVEKTENNKVQSVIGKKHLHVCGENRAGGNANRRAAETPPRVWRKHHQNLRYPFYRRNTSTCVEKTCKRIVNSLFRQKHLHVCGENTKICGTLFLHTAKYSVF